MKYTLILILLCFIGCKQPGDNKQIKIVDKPIDTSKYAILKFPLDSISYSFDKNCKPANLSSVELIKIESLIVKRAAEYNKKEKEFWQKIDDKRDRKKFPNAVPFIDTISDSKSYYKQLIAVIDSKGEKQVWVNCFCTPGEKSYWRKEFVLVSDGGSCYFQVKINLTKGSIIGFWVNGVA